MKKPKKYPSRIYNGITDDPDTWGMCCSKEMAYRCAESNYKAPSIFEKLAWFILCALEAAVTALTTLVLYLFWALLMCNMIGAAFTLFCGAATRGVYIVTSILTGLIAVPIIKDGIQKIVREIHYGYSVDSWITTLVWIVTWVLATILSGPVIASIMGA